MADEDTPLHKEIVEQKKQADADADKRGGWPTKDPDAK